MDDEYDDELDDYEPDDGDEWDDDPEGDMVACPRCGAKIFEDSVQCPVCGDYVTFRSNAWAGRSFVWIVLGVLGVIATICVLLVS